MSQYQTKQRKTLVDFLSCHPDEALSAKQITAALADEKISLSAVYRNLTALEDAGLLKRMSKAGTREIYYQYLNVPTCKDCLHLSCTQCGRTFHMKADLADVLIDNLAQKESFMLDKSDTILYGICQHCQHREHHE